MPGADGRYGKQRVNHPNECFRFISTLKEYDDSDEAEHLLRALAAAVKPIMKDNGLQVNSLEEHEWNPGLSVRDRTGLTRQSSAAATGTRARCVDSSRRTH